MPETIEQDLVRVAEEINEQDIAALAYELWQARGCPDRSAEEDWFRALEQMRHSSSPEYLE